jgi:hypothetical protein
MPHCSAPPAGPQATTTTTTDQRGADWQGVLYLPNIRQCLCAQRSVVNAEAIRRREHARFSEDEAETEQAHGFSPDLVIHGLAEILQFAFTRSTT